MSYSGPVPFPTEIKDPVYSGAGNGGGWLQAPSASGSLDNQQAMNGPFPTRSVQSASENYSDGANKAVVGQPLLTVCSNLPCPEHANPSDAILKIKKGYKTRLIHGQGVVANVGEITFVHNPRPIAQALLEKKTIPESAYDPIAQILMPGQDELMVAVEGMTVSQFNEYLSQYDKFAWSPEDIDNLLDHINIYGVVEAVGPGNNALLERNVKSYVHAVERKCSVSDIWDTNETRAGAFLFFRLLGEATLGNKFAKLRVEPFVTLDIKAAKVPDSVKTQTVLHYWFVGTYRSMTQLRQVNGTVLKSYISGENPALQQMLPICEINFAL